MRDLNQIKQGEQGRGRFKKGRCGQSRRTRTGSRNKATLAAAAFLG